MPAPTRQPTVGWLLFSPSGRAGRQVFILGWLLWMCLNGASIASLVMHQEEEELFRVLSLLFFASVTLSVVSTVMLSIKRLHDMGLTGFLAVLLFIPAVSFVILFVLCLWPSANGANAYGPAPDWPDR
ncbi:MAG: DUF805 domain-containing protein [Allorhizobium sp.]